MRGFDQFRRANARASSLRPQSGFAPRSMDYYKINVSESGVVRVLDPGDDGFFVFARHWVGRPHTCTAQWPGFEGKCVYCHYLNLAMDARNKGTDTETHKKDLDNLYPGTARLVEVIDYRYFHIVPDGDKQSVVRCGSDDYHPRRSTCQWCAHQDPKIAERHFGGHKLWEFGKNHFNQLGGVHAKLAAVCIAETADGGICGQGIYTIGFQCSHCAQHEFITENDLRTKSDEEIDAIISQEHECPVCKKADYPEPVRMCESEMHEAVPATIFDKELEVTCAGETYVDKRGRERKTSTLNFDRSFPFASVGDRLKEHGFDADQIAAICKPWDLAHRVRPEWLDPAKFTSTHEYIAAVLAAQAKVMQRPNPFADAPSGPRSQPFSRGSGDRRFR